MAKKNLHPTVRRNELLFNEWKLNYGYNPIMERYCRKMGVLTRQIDLDYNIDCWELGKDAVRDMNACREYCRKQGLWFETEGELYAFFDVFDVELLQWGFNRNNVDIEDCLLAIGTIEELRRWCACKGKTWRNFRYNDDVMVCRKKTSKQARISTKPFEDFYEAKRWWS